MRSFNANDKDDRKTVKDERIEPWMLALLALNPEYTCWGPYEDYMTKEGGWDGRLIAETWADAPRMLDSYNECVHFYFYAERDSKTCEACDGSGHNPETKAIADGFYAHSSPTGRGWNDAITQDEVEALQEQGRLRKWINGAWTRVPLSAAEVNAANRRGGMLADLGHDGINRWILIETRAKRLGVFGDCATCKGKGHVYTADAARLGIVLWLLHPRKGCSRGVDVRNIRRDELPQVRKYLTDAAQRNAERFARVANEGGWTATRVEAGEAEARGPRYTPGED